MIIIISINAAAAAAGGNHAKNASSPARDFIATPLFIGTCLEAIARSRYAFFSNFRSSGEEGEFQNVSKYFPPNANVANMLEMQLIDLARTRLSRDRYRMIKTFHTGVEFSMEDTQTRRINRSTERTVESSESVIRKAEDLHQTDNAYSRNVSTARDGGRTEGVERMRKDRGRAFAAR